MEFGKLENTAGVDIRLPPDPPENAIFLKNLPPRTEPPRLFLGATGWAMKEWVGSIYPEKARSSDFLKHYSLQFNTIELNTTHYRIPEKATVLSWKNAVPTDFRFCPKVPQVISHSRDLGFGSGELRAFCEAILHFEETMGCIFLQLPPHFSLADLPILERFLENWPSAIPLAVEVRHESFFQKKEAVHFFQLLENQRVAPCLSDVAGRRDVLHLRLTSERILIRFMSSGENSTTDLERADDWAARLADWFAAGLREVFFFAHTPDNVRAPEMAMILEEKFRAAVPDLEIRGPRFLQRSQGSLF